MIKLYYKYQEIVNYLIFGVITTLVSLLTYYLLTITFLNPRIPLELQLSNIISWIVGVLVAYVTNRKYVFKSKGNNKIYEFTNFILSRLLTLVFDMLFMFVLVSKWGLNDRVCKIISQIIIIITNYLFSKLFIFKNR